MRTTYPPGLVLNRALLCGWLFLAVSQPGGLPGGEGSAWDGQKKPPAPAARSPGSFLCSAGLRERDAVLLGGFPLLLRSDAVHRLLGELEVSPSCPPATWFPRGKGGTGSGHWSSCCVLGSQSYRGGCPTAWGSCDPPLVSSTKHLVCDLRPVGLEGLCWVVGPQFAECPPLPHECWAYWPRLASPVVVLEPPSVGQACPQKPIWTRDEQRLPLDGPSAPDSSCLRIAGPP